MPTRLVIPRDTVPESSEHSELESDINTTRRQRSTIVPFSKTLDPTISWFYQPISLTVFGSLVAALAALAFFIREFHLPDRIKNHLGILTAVASFELWCMISVRDGPFSRPHPVIWRAILGFNFLYWMFLCWLYFHDLDFARTTVMPFFDSSLGKPVKHKVFNENCDFTVHNFKAQAFEIFSLAHSLGWMGKALILRDWWLINILSVGYELIEYSLAHHLPEFNECWWDHWILDVGGCNFIGSWVGMKICKNLEVSHFSWRGRRSRTGGFRDRSAAVVEHLTPFDFANFSWDSVRRFRNYLSTLILLSTFLISEVDAFYIKHLLWLPTDHPLVIIRLAFMFLWSLPAVREFYEYVNQSKQVKRFGMHVWMILATVILELLIVIKWSRESGEFHTPTPRAVKISWSIFITLLIVYPLWKFALRRKHTRSHKSTANGHAHSN